MFGRADKFSSLNKLVLINNSFVDNKLINLLIDGTNFENILINNFINGIKNGYYIQFSENGHISETGFFIDDKIHRIKK